MHRGPVSYRGVRSGLIRNRLRVYPRGVELLRNLLEPGSRLTQHVERRANNIRPRVRTVYRTSGGANRYGIVYERTVQKLLRLEMLRQIPGEQLSYGITDTGRRLVRKHDLQDELTRMRCNGDRAGVA